MQIPEPADDYSYGQMMGMLVIIRTLKNKGSIPAEVIEDVERMASDYLSVYLDKPAEDVILLVDSKIDSI